MNVKYGLLQGHESFDCNCYNRIELSVYQEKYMYWRGLNEMLKIANLCVGVSKVKGDAGGICCSYYSHRCSPLLLKLLSLWLVRTCYPRCNASMTSAGYYSLPPPGFSRYPFIKSTNPQGEEKLGGLGFD